MWLSKNLEKTERSDTVENAVAGKDGVYVACAVCGVRAAQNIGETYGEAGIAYTLHACTACGVQFWTPFKNPGAAWYEHDTRYAGRNADPMLTPNEKHIGVMHFLEGKTGRVLDIGCGVGNFLALAKARGWEGWGIDFDKDAITAGKRTFGLEHLEVASVQEFAAAHKNLTFDLITFFDVFEHLDNHREFLELVKRLLAPGGSIALSVPYRHAWRWLIPNDLPPRHLTRWDEQSLGTTLARHGFHVVWSNRLSAGLYFLALKLRFRYGAWTSFGLVHKAKRADARGDGGAVAGTHRISWRTRIIAQLAKVKDLVLFGIPGVLMWCALFPTKKRYTDIYLVAEMKHE